MYWQKIVKFEDWWRNSWLKLIVRLANCIISIMSVYLNINFAILSERLKCFHVLMKKISGQVRLCPWAVDPRSEDAGMLSLRHLERINADMRETNDRILNPFGWISNPFILDRFDLIKSLLLLMKKIPYFHAFKWWSWYLFPSIMFLCSFDLSVYKREVFNILNICFVLCRSKLCGKRKENFLPKLKYSTKRFFQLYRCLFSFCRQF